MPLTLLQTIHLCQNKREKHLHSGFFIASLLSHISVMKLWFRVGLQGPWFLLLLPLQLEYVMLPWRIFIFWADTLLSPAAPVCLSQPWFLYNLAVQLHSNDFPISYRFKISDFNKHLLHFVSNENFSQPAGFFLSSSTAHDIICMLMTLTCLSTFYSSYSSYCVAHVILAFVKLKPIISK